MLDVLVITVATLLAEETLRRSLGCAAVPVQLAVPLERRLLPLKALLQIEELGTEVGVLLLHLDNFEP
jgi:hypothetical protein